MATNIYKKKAKIQNKPGIFCDNLSQLIISNLNYYNNIIFSVFQFSKVKKQLIQFAQFIL